MAHAVAQDRGIEGKKGRVINSWYTDLAFLLAREDANVVCAHRKLCDNTEIPRILTPLASERGDSDHEGDEDGLDTEDLIGTSLRPGLSTHDNQDDGEVVWIWKRRK